MAQRLLSKTYWHGSQVRFRTPVDAHGLPVRHKTTDVADIRGIYWTPKSNPKPKVAVIAAHQRGDFSQHHAFPRLLEAGYACMGANLRNVNNDIDCIHEKLLIDIATHMRWLKEVQGIEKIVFLGNSGGGSLFSFYQSQACQKPADRLKFSPGGRPTGLDREEMPEGDAIIYMAAHTGQGLIINETIDPAVIDEANPLLSDPELDMYDPRNGFKEAPEWTHYDPDFVKTYRAAQLRRMRRLDAWAEEMIAENTRAEALHADPDFERLDPDARRMILRREAFEPIMIIYRTMANLNYVDKNLDPSPRGYGSLLSERPDLMNFQRMAFARIQTPHAWLSTWSGLSSQASTFDSAPKVTLPAVVVHAGKDLDVYPETHSKRTFENLASKDKEYWDFPEALHYFEAEEDDPPTAKSLDQLMDRLIPWIGERAPL